jgi:signal recognition particle subunit SRP54
MASIMFEGLGERLDDIFRRLRGKGRLSEKDVEAALREVRLALLEADVALEAVKVFLARVRERAVGREVLKSVTPGQQVVKIVHDQLVELLGGHTASLGLAPKPPTKVLLAGLQGSGKTTTAAKLGGYFRKKNQRVLLVAADLQRPAAIRQLEVLGDQVGIAVHADLEATDPVKVSADGLERGLREADIVIVDTAGRLHIDEEMMDEVERVHQAVQPHETLFVLDAMVGQDAVNSARAFSETLPLTGMVLTKIDGDARGGAALSAVTVTGVPIKFAGTGERLVDLEPFHPDRIASRILGMGDVVTLVERAEETISKETAEEQARKVLEARFTLEDFLEQVQQLRKMGGIADVLKMMPGIPGVGKVKDLEIDDSDVARLEAIIRSMTPKERSDPRIISGNRRRRIADGSGTSVREVNDLLKQFAAARKMAKQMGKMAKGKGMGLPGGLG